MKKLVFAAFAALLSLGLYAQSFSLNEDGSPVEDSDGWSMWSSDSSFGWGYHVMLEGDADFLGNTPSFGKNREIFFTLLGGEFRPVKYVGLSGTIDLNWDAYRLNKTHYWNPDNNGGVAIAPVEGSGYNRIKKSVLRSFGFDVPVQLKFYLGDVCIAGGIVGEFNFNGRTKFKAVDGSGTTVKNGDMRVTDIKSIPLTYSYRASITYSHLGIYGKYSPCSQFEQGFGPQFSYWTVGLIFW